MARKPPRARGARTPGRRTDVGYGRPPVEHQFRPGQSGNKRGRPKGSKSEAAMINELLSQKITVNQNGKARKISLFEGIYLRIVEDALKGNTKSAAFLLGRLATLAEPAGQDATLVMDPNDKEVLEFFKQHLKEQLGEQGENK